MKPTLLLIHGWAFDAGVWQPLTAMLEEHFTLLVPSLETMGDDVQQGLAEWISKQAITDELFVAGWSLGFLLALGLREQITISRIAALGALPCFRSPNGIASGVMRDILENLAGNKAQVLRKFYQWVFYPSRPALVPDRTFDTDYLLRTLQLLHDLDYSELWSAGRLPDTLFMFGERDAVLPATAIQDFPGIRYVVYERSGHAFFLEHKRDVVRRMVAFFCRGECSD